MKKTEQPRNKREGIYRVIFKMIDDGTYCVTQYSEGKTEVILPDWYCGVAVTGV